MLVLSRSRDEAIIIGDTIEISIVDIHGDRVKLGINAPRNISVHRKEVWVAIKKANDPKLSPIDLKNNQPICSRCNHSLSSHDGNKCTIPDCLCPGYKSKDSNQQSIIKTIKS